MKPPFRFWRGVVALCCLSALLRGAPTLTLIAPSSGSATTTSSALNSFVVASTDERYITFLALGNNLISGVTDTNASSDLFQLDVQTGVTTLISHSSSSTTTAGAVPAANSGVTNKVPGVSSDGRYVVYVSSQTDLVASFGGTQNAYLWDRTTNTNVHLFGGSGSTTTFAQFATMSADGAWIAIGTDGDMPKNIYSGSATYTSAGAGWTNLYLINRVSGAVTLATHASGNANAPVAYAVQNNAFLSSDGQYAAFQLGGATTNIVSGWDAFTGSYVSGSQSIYVYDRVADTMKLVTKKNDGSAPSTIVTSPAVQCISPDGRYVYFTHGDIDFGAASADSNTFNDTYRWDRDGGATKLARLFYDVYAVSPTGGSSANFSSATLTVSPNGRYMAFNSPLSSWVSGDTNGRADAFRFDTTDSSVVRVSVNSNGSEWTTATNGSLFLSNQTTALNSGNVIFATSATSIGFTDSNSAFDLVLATFPAPAVAPTVTTATQASVTATSATLGGDVTSDGGATVTDRGIVWATTSNPTTSNTKVANGTGTGAFSATVTGLTSSSTIHVRAYAINSAGTSYGSDISFSTPALDTTKPTVVSVVRQTPSTQNLTTATTTVTFRVTYSETVTGVVAANFQIENINGGTITGTIGTPTGSTNVYDVPVTLTGGSGEFRLKVIN